MEHKIVKEESSVEFKESQELDFEIKEFQEGGSVCNILACENSNQQVSEEVEVTELEVLTVRVSDKKSRGNNGIIEMMRNEGGVACAVTLGQSGDSVRAWREMFEKGMRLSANF